MKFHSRSQKFDKARSDAGYTMTEAMAALVAVSFLMICFGELFMKLRSIYIEARSDVEIAKQITHGIVHTINNQDGEDGFSLPAQASIIFQTSHSDKLDRLKVNQDNCLYDTIGRRCR